MRLQPSELMMWYMCMARPWQASGWGYPTQKLAKVFMRVQLRSAHMHRRVPNELPWRAHA